MVRCIKGTANSSIFWSYTCILQLHVFANLTSDSACSPCSLALNLANFRLIAKWFTNDQRQKNLIIHHWTSTYYLSYLYGCMNKRLALLLENKIACLIGKLHSLQREKRHRVWEIRTRTVYVFEQTSPIIQIQLKQFHTIYNANYALENAKMGTETRGNNWWKEESELMKLASITGGTRNWHACSGGQWWRCW